MFEYLNEKLKFTIKLGQIISHEIVKPMERFATDSKLRSVEELNNLNRYDVANKVIFEMPTHLLEGDYTKEQLINDVAHYIDARIPQSYAKWVNRDHSKGPSQTKVNASDYGLVYHFKEEKKNTKKTPSKTKKENLETNNKKSINEQVKESNFVQLNNYLKEKGLFIEQNEYKSILFAMNGMTIYFQTKTQAVKKASQLFNITQKFVKEHIDSMGIVSERELKSRKEFGKSQAIAMSQLKNQLDSENN